MLKVNVFTECLNKKEAEVGTYRHDKLKWVFVDSNRRLIFLHHFYFTPVRQEQKPIKKLHSEHKKFEHTSFSFTEELVYFLHGGCNQEVQQR